MAASVLTFTAGQFKYIDVGGMEHTVTTSQTISMTLVDAGAADVQYSFATGQSVTTTDGRRITVRPHTDMAAGTAGNTNRTIGLFTDAGQGTAFTNVRGELIMESPESFTIQVWKIVQATPSNADFDAAGTLTITLEDQFGHKMNIPFALSGTVAVGQVA